jgi:lysophospholipase L1-like esterase
MGFYVALGDSMSIDAYAGGPGRGAASLLARNRDADFPDWAGRDLAAAGLTPEILASDGATSRDVVAEQVPLVIEPPALVTLTIGGNDLLIAYGQAAAAYAAVEAVVAAGEEILRRLSLIGAGLVVVTTVYDPSDGTGELPTTALTPWPEGPSVLAALNTALRDLADRHGAVIADVHQSFLGHGATAGDPGQSESHPANRDLWYCRVIEPNAWGAHHIRRIWWEVIEGNGGLPTR